MSQVASTSTAVGLPKLHHSSSRSSHQPPRVVNFSSRFPKKFRLNRRIFYQNNTDPVDAAATEEKPESEINGVTANTTTTETTSSIGSGFPLYPDKTFNRRIALGSVFAAFGLFLSKRLDFGVSLKDLSAAALPYEEV